MTPAGEEPPRPPRLWLFVAAMALKTATVLAMLLLLRAELLPRWIPITGGIVALGAGYIHVGRTLASPWFAQCRRQRQLLPLPWQIALVIGLPGCLVDYVLIVTAGIPNQTDTFVWMLPLYALIVGASLVGHGLSTRVGTTRHCRDCAYERPETNPPPCCTECGADWGRAGGAVIGRPVRRPWMVWTGAGVGTAGILSVAIYLAAMSSLVSVIPTSLLLHRAPAVSGATDRVWDELLARGLNEQQQIELANRLLDRPAQNTSLRALTWLEGLIIAEALPGPMVNRYFEDAVTVRFELPQNAVTSSELILTVEAESRANGRLLAPSVFFAGFYLNDDPSPVGRADRILPGQLFASPFTNEYRPREVLATPTAGTLRVRMLMWVSVGTPTYGPAGWTPDGLPTFPPGTLWSKRIELERAVEITP